MLDPRRLVDAPLPEHVTGWSERDVILYALGLGVGTPELDQAALRYLYEADLQVLPTFGALSGMLDMEEVLSLPGADFDPNKMLHGQQEVWIHQPVPRSADGVTRTGRVAGVHDKGKAAVLVFDTETELAGAPLVSTRATCFIRDAGGFGESLGAEPGATGEVPDRDPDLVVTRPTAPSLAALYRLSGDLNPLHIDPDLARGVGFDRPILHGMCSFGIAVTAVVDGLLDGDVKDVRHVRTRFAGVAFPGDPLVVSAWRSPDGARFTASREDGSPVLVGGAVLTSSKEH